MTTLVTAAQISQLRRMVAEPTAATYSDASLTSYIEMYPRIDLFGTEPFIYTMALPPVATSNTEWVPTYDLCAAAADVWDEKAAGLATKVDFSADGGNYSMSQQYQFAVSRAKYYRSRRMATTTKLHKSPAENTSSYPLWVGNDPEPD
jgi:hypothetical protein